MESTCRSVPTREKIIALGKGYVRGLFGGLEQGAGINGGVQFTSKETIPNLELRANFIASTRFDRRVDFEALIPHVGSRKNHIDTWFSYLNRDTKFFGIGPRLARASLTDFTVEQRSTQISFTRDLAKHLKAASIARSSMCMLLWDAVRTIPLSINFFPVIQIRFLLSGRRDFFQIADSFQRWIRPI
jgi:hypothetical protein